jgi:HlyD family secretion protein
MTSSLFHGTNTTEHPQSVPSSPDPSENIMRRLILALGIPALAVVLYGTLAAPARQQPADSTKPAEKKEAAPATVKVTKGNFKIDHSFKGVLEATEMTELVFRPKQWTSGMQVLEAVLPGTQVKKGDALLKPDLEKIDKALKEMETDHKLADLAHKQAEIDNNYSQRLMQLEMEQAELAKKMAEDDFQKFTAKDKVFAEKMVLFQVRNATNNVAYAKEELKQLEKMYKANDLIEDTEQIIITRQKNQVESAEFFLKTAENRRDDTMQVDLPRRERSLKDSLERQTLALERLKEARKYQIQQKELAFEKAKYERSKAAERFEQTKADRDAMLVKAPCDGILFYGRSVKGKWTNASSIAEKFRKGGSSISNEEVFMTIVQLRPLQIQASVDEKTVQQLQTGQTGSVTLPTFDDLRLTAKLEKIALVPLTPGSYEVVLSLNVPEDAPRVLPGMDCNVKLVTFDRKDALTVPTASVFMDEEDDAKKYVWLPAAAGGKPTKQHIKTGKSHGGKTEILDGLKEGDSILQSKP